MNRAIFRTVAFLTVMFSCFSCNNTLLEMQDENMPQGTARLRLNIADAPSGNARTIFATDDDVTITSYDYVLSGKRQGKDEETIYFYSDENYPNGKRWFTYSELISSDFLIKVGVWEYITLSAHGRSTYSGTVSNVEIIEGTNELTFNMIERRNEDFSGYGNFKVTLNLPKDAEVDSVSAKVFSLDGTIVRILYSDGIIGGYKGDYLGIFYDYSTDSKYVVYQPSWRIAAGIYILSFEFYKPSEEDPHRLVQMKPSYSELIQIENGLTSTAERTIEDFEKLHSIEYNLNGGKISGNSIPASFIEQETVLLPTAQNISKDQYNFVGWYETEDFSGDIITEIPSGTKKDVTLFAKWEFDEGFVIRLEAEDAISSLAQILSENTKDGPFSIIITGTLTSEQLSSIAQIIKDSGKRIDLDLSGTSGLDKISVNTFKDCTKLESIVIPRGVTEIESNAFYRCTSLKTITVPSTLVKIGTDAFYSCVAINTVHCASVESWRKIEFGNDYNSNPLNPLKSDRKAYANGNDITDAIYTYKISYAGVNGASNSNPKTYDSRVGLTLANPVATTKFDGWTLNGGKVTEISIRTKGDITLTANWKEGFYATARNAAEGSLKSWLENQTGVGPFNVNITGTLTSDYLSAIVTVLKTYPKKLVKLDLSETTGLTELNGFLGCESLETIIIPDGVKTIGAAAFGNCSNLTDITLPGSIESINTTVWGSSDGAFNGCNSLTNVRFNGSIGNWCVINFECDTSNPLYYAKHFFIRGEETKNIKIPNGVTSINSLAFRHVTYIESVTIPGSVKTIGEHSFYNCTGLKTVTIEDGVKTIGAAAFGNCSNLTDITLPGSIESINTTVWGSSDGAFNGCNSLTNVHFNGSIDDWCVINFECDTSNPLYCAKHFYIDNEEQTAITINAKNIDKYVFYNCKSIQSVTIESGVTHIEANAFYGCTNLASATFKDTVGWYNESNNAALDVTDATANAAKLRATGNGNWGDSDLRKK